MRRICLVVGISLIVLFIAFWVCMYITPDVPDEDKRDWPLYVDIIMTTWVCVSIALIGCGGWALVAIGLGLATKTIEKLAVGFGVEPEAFLKK